MSRLPRLIVDPEADAAYLEIGRGKVADTVPIDPAGFRGQIVFDLDREGRLLGLEILDASRQLPTDAMDAAHPYPLWVRILVRGENLLPRKRFRP